MVENRSLFQKNDTRVSAEVDQFLERLKHGPGGSGRLIFSLDATASRLQTWDLASKLEAQMFQEAAAIGGLSLQLVYYRGFGECKASGWVSESGHLLRLMEKITCRTGVTQLERILIHAKKETAKQPVSAMVFVGDAMEENADVLIARARELGRLGTAAFMFQEGQDPTVQSTFRDIARHSGGAYGRFDAGAAKQLSELLKAAAVIAAGGAQALAGRQDKASRLLLEQMRRNG